MKFRRFSLGVSVMVLTATILAAPQYVHAETPAAMGASSPPAASSEPAKTTLMGLARDFVNRVKSGYQQADAYVASYYGPDLQAPDEYVDIPDGEILLLEIALSRSFKLPDNVMAIKQGRDVMISLLDFTGAARFPIDLLPAERRAEGWFIREEKRFFMDLDAGTVRVQDQEYAIAEGDVIEQNDDFFIRATSLAQWLGFTMKTSLQKQTLEIASPEKWPVQEFLDRRKRRPWEGPQPATLPRQEIPYKITSLPNADINTRYQYRRSGEDKKSETSRSYTITSSGDLGLHTAQAVITGDDEDPLASGRLTFSREAEKPTLLGPLKARYYEFGDITAARLPQAGGAKSGLGFRATNSNQNVVTSATTPITGDGTPGWDVEIYRNNQLLGTSTVDDDGRYSFESVRLIPGQNNFRIVSYGPFGEIREEQQSFYATADLVGLSESVYDVSVTAADTKFWQENSDNPAEDRNEPQFSGLYETQIGAQTTFRTGARSVTSGQDRKEYLYSGASTNIGETLANLDIGYDIDEAWRVDSTVRRRFGNHAASAFSSFTSDDYASVSGQVSPSSYDFGATLDGGLGGLIGYPVTYDFKSEYDVSETGATSFENTLGLSTKINNLGLSQNFSLVSERSSEGVETDSLDGRSSVRGTALGMRWRTSAQYEIDPVFEAKSYELDLTRRIAKNIRTNLNIEHEPNPKSTEGTASVSFTGKRVTLSPTVSYDTDKNFGAFLNVRTGLTYDPLSKDVIFSGRSVAGQGGVSARVFLDKDGNFQFSEGDELIEYAVVEAVQSGRTAESDKDGIAFLNNLPAGRPTDVILQEYTLQDAFWIPARESVSIQPRPGVITQLDFPVHVAGEIDGTVYRQEAAGNKIPARSVRLYLQRVSDGQVAATATSGNDGFYIFERLLPGTYYLMIDAEDLAKYQAAAPLPQEITIRHDGTSLYGNNIVVQSGPKVAFQMPQDYGEFISRHPGIDLSGLKEGGVVLNLGDYNSHLMMAITWYGLKNRNPDILKNARLLVPATQSMASARSGRHTLRVVSDAETLEDGQRSCLAITAKNNISCTVEILTPAMLQTSMADVSEIKP